MKRFRQILFWLTLVLILALVVLCIIGAFLGATRAKEMFNSIPMWFFWGLWAVLLAVGLFAWGKMWRSPGLLAIHVGLLLILTGGLWGSKTAHGWREMHYGLPRVKKPRGYYNPSEGFLLFNLQDESTGISRRLWDLPPQASPVEIGTLPFDVEVRRAWIEYYPPEQNHWRLLGVMFDETGRLLDVTPLFGEVGLPGLFPAIKGEVTVLGYDHTRREMELQLTSNGESLRKTISLCPEDAPTTLLLPKEFEPSRTLQKTGRAGIRLMPPHQDIRDYKAELVLLDSDGKTDITRVIEINHPLHAKGYHFYLSAFDPPLALVVRAVSDDGLYWVYAGFGLLMLGVILRFWIEPTLTFFSRWESQSEARWESFPTASHEASKHSLEISAVGRDSHRAGDSQEANDVE